MGDNVSSCLLKIKLEGQGRRLTIHNILASRCSRLALGQEESTFAGCSKRPSSKAAASEDPEAYPLGYVEDLNDARTKLATFFSILFLHEQQAGLANLLPGGRTQKDFKLFDGPWKSRFRFPEERVKTRWAVLSCGVLNQIVKPLRLRVCEGDGLIAAVPWKNESCFFSSLLTNRLPAEPDESPLCLRVICGDSFLEEMSYPRGGDAWPWHGMVEPLADVDREAASFQIIQQRPSQPFAEPLGRFTLFGLGAAGHSPQSPETRVRECAIHG